MLEVCLHIKNTKYQETNIFVKLSVFVFVSVSVSLSVSVSVFVFFSISRTKSNICFASGPFVELCDLSILIAPIAMANISENFHKYIFVDKIEYYSCGEPNRMTKFRFGQCPMDIAWHLWNVASASFSCETQVRVAPILIRTGGGGVTDPEVV